LLYHYLVEQQHTTRRGLFRRQLMPLCCLLSAALVDVFATRVNFSEFGFLLYVLLESESTRPDLTCTLACYPKFTLRQSKLHLLNSDNFWCFQRNQNSTWLFRKNLLQ